MALIPSGVYTIKESQGPNFLVFSDPGPNVAVRRQLPSSDNPSQQQWMLQETASKGTYTIKNLRTDTYLGYETLVKDSPVIGSSQPKEFVLQPRPLPLEFVVRVKEDQTLVLGQAELKYSPRTATLQPFRELDHMQVWTLEWPR